MALGVLNASNYDVVVFLFTLATCFCATRIVRKIETRIDMVFASVSIALFNIVFIFLLKVLFNDNFAYIGYLSLALAINGFICGILALGFITPLEQVLNTASVFRLIDLSDLNNPTMRKFLLNASGTYNHSMMVATLAENACKEIGANSLVARVGAYYHDIGKMEQSEYFVENQTGQNKHDDINPLSFISKDVTCPLPLMPFSGEVLKLKSTSPIPSPRYPNVREKRLFPVLLIVTSLVGSISHSVM